MKYKILILFVLVSLILVNCTNKPIEKPNIVYIMLDEWGYYEMSALGHPLLETPNIDEFKEEGIRFTQMLAGAPACAPTRATLMLGQHTGHSTVRGNQGNVPIKDEDMTVAEVLKKAGYATGGFGKWGIGDRGTSGAPEDQGFDVFFGYYHQVHAHTYYPNYLLRNSEKIPLRGNTGHAWKGETFSQYLIHDEAKKFIKDHAGKQPFFAYLPYTLPHAFYGIPEDDPAYLKFKDRSWDAPPHHTNPAVAPPDEAKRYAAFMAMADRQIKEILEILKETGIDENTIVFLSGDNGGNTTPFSNEKYPYGFFAPNTDPITGVRFRGHKGNLYEGGLRVPYLVRWPGKIKPGSESDHLGYFPDVLPTLAELAGAKVPGKVDGISFLPTLVENMTDKQEQHKFLYWEYNSQVAVRKGNWKAVRPRETQKFELYNLQSDISEENNVADEYPDILAELKEFAEKAHLPQEKGEVYDEAAGFQGHNAK